MTTLSAYIDGIGLIGPGLDGWEASRAMLAGEAAYAYAKTAIPAPSVLPPAERRRCGPIVKLSIATGLQAAAAAGRDPAALPTVFSASGGDGSNCHEICAMLATDDRLISPTRFHNSVHNAASGYWSIATGAMAASSVLCAHDASFGAGLLEAVTQVAVDRDTVLLIACDTTYPEPLRAKRPIPEDFGVALVLAPQAGASSIARITVALGDAPVMTIADAALDMLRAEIPAARCLPLLQAIAAKRTASVTLGYLDNASLSVDVSPCA